MKTIIVTTDFSPASTNAMNYAADMALQINASLVLFHVYQVPLAVTDTPLVLVSLDDLKESAERDLIEAKKGLEHITSGKLKIETEITLGNITDELETLCEKIQPFAVIMGTTGKSGLERTLFGSTTLVAIKQLTWPIIAVPVGKEYGAGIRKVGLACDFREVIATTPVAAIRDFVTEFQAELHVMNVDYDNRQQHPETLHQAVLLRTALEKCNPEYHFIKHKDIEDGINEFAENNNLDMVIAIPKKHRLLDGLFKKSSTRQLVFESHVPVMCVHE